MPHSYHGRVISELNVNGVMGEFGVNAYIPGDYGVPVILVSGDAEAVTEGRQLVPNNETAVCRLPS
jgi:D-amino peptidase